MLHDACHPPLTPTHEIPVTHTPYCCTKPTDDAAFIMLNLVSCDTHTLDGSGSSLSVGWSPSRGWVSSSSPGSRLRGLLSARGLSSCRMQRDAEHCRGGGVSLGVCLLQHSAVLRIVYKSERERPLRSRDKSWPLSRAVGAERPGSRHEHICMCSMCTRT